VILSLLIIAATAERTWISLWGRYFEGRNDELRKRSQLATRIEAAGPFCSRAPARWHQTHDDGSFATGPGTGVRVGCLCMRPYAANPVGRASRVGRRVRRSVPRIRT